MKRIYTLYVVGVFVAAAVFRPLIAAGAEKISRQIAGLELGMSAREAEKILEMEEREDGTIILMRRYKFGDPDERAKLNKLIGKQVFTLKSNLPKGVESAEAFFLKGVLYQVALHYGKNYVQQVSWEIFTSPAIRKYGQPMVADNIHDTGSFSYQWSDGETKLEIAKNGTISSDKNKFDATIYNVFFTDVSLYELIAIDEKRMQTRDTLVPNY